MSSEFDFRQKNDILLTGSISHRFIDDFTHFNSQYDYYKLEMAEDEIVLLQVHEHYVNWILIDLINRYKYVLFFVLVHGKRIEAKFQ